MQRAEHEAERRQRGGGDEGDGAGIAEGARAVQRAHAEDDEDHDRPDDAELHEPREADLVRERLRAAGGEQRPGERRRDEDADEPGGGARRGQRAAGGPLDEELPRGEHAGGVRDLQQVAGAPEAQLVRGVGVEPVGGRDPRREQGDEGDEEGHGGAAQRGGDPARALAGGGDQPAAGEGHGRAQRHEREPHEVHRVVEHRDVVGEHRRGGDQDAGAEQRHAGRGDRRPEPSGAAARGEEVPEPDEERGEPHHQREIDVDHQPALEEGGVGDVARDRRQPRDHHQQRERAGDHQAGDGEPEPAAEIVAIGGAHAERSRQPACRPALPRRPRAEVDTRVYSSAPRVYASPRRLDGSDWRVVCSTGAHAAGA